MLDINLIRERPDFYEIELCTYSPSNHSQVSGLPARSETFEPHSIRPPLIGWASGGPRDRF